MINDSDYEYDVSKGVFDGQEMYQVSIKIVNGTHKRVNVFVTYGGDVVSVGSQFPAPTPPEYPENKKSPVLFISFFMMSSIVNINLYYHQ